jgi:plastocyanin
MKIRSFLVALFLIPVMVLLSACSHDQQSGGGTTSNSPDPDADFTIEAVNFEYTPNEISGKPGETITVTINGSGHDFVIDELDVSTGVFFGSRTVSIKIPEDAEPGDEYEFYCSVSNHRAMGMVGTLVVN